MKLRILHQLHSPPGVANLIPRNGWSCLQQLGQQTPLENRSVKIGVHGGLSRAEMLIPFLAYRF